MNQENHNLIIVLEYLVKESEEQIIALGNEYPEVTINRGYRLMRQKQALETARKLVSE